MKKFITFALAALVIFAMCSCQPTVDNMDGKVEFKVAVGAQASKALTANDPGKDAVAKIQLAFLPLEQAAVECEYLAHEGTIVAQDKQSTSSSKVWADGLIEWNTTSKTANWYSDAKLYLSQGKWTIFAQALSSTNKVLYEGQQTVYINKKNSSCAITMIPVANDATGKVILKGLTANQVFTEKEKEKLTYSISGITGTSDAVTGDLLASSATGGVVTFADSNEITLKQGSYLVAVRLQQDTRDDGATSAVWTDYTGGSILDIGVYDSKTTTVEGRVDTSDYIKTVPTVSLSEAEFTLTIEDTQEDAVTVNLADGTYSAKFTATIEKVANNPNAKTATIYWYIDGQAYTTGVTPLNGALTSTIEPTLAHGKHNIQAYVVGYADTTVQSTTIDAQSSVASFSRKVNGVTYYNFDTADKLATN